MTTSNEIALPSRPAAPARIGQATAIEQSRAVAEVYAAVMIAREAPRDIQAAIRAMQEACQTPELANRAFYSVPRGGKTATDVSVHLARELATCWGNTQSHVAELHLDEEHGQSEMQAVAWDLERNNRVALTFIQPHKRAGKGAERLVDVQAIYETNANAGARRLRQCILAVLPNWYVERAKALCQKTLNDGGGKPLPERISDALKLFEEFNVTESDIARTLGRSADRWTPVDLGKLRITYESLKQGTITRDDAFPAPTVSRQDIAAARTATEPATADQPRDYVADSTPGRLNAADSAPAAEPAEPTESASDPAPAAPAALVAKLKTQLVKLEVTKPAEQLKVIGQVAGRRITAWADITTADGQAAAELFNRAGHADEPARALDQLLAERADNQEETP